MKYAVVAAVLLTACAGRVPAQAEVRVEFAQRVATLDVLAAQNNPGSTLEEDMLRAVKSVLDPKNVLGN